MKKIIANLVALSLMTSAVQAADGVLEVQINNGAGFIRGDVKNGKFKMTHIQENGPKVFKISGDLFKGQSLKTIKDECEYVHAVVPSVLKKDKRSLYISAQLFDYNQKDLSEIVGVEAATGVHLYSITPELIFGAKAMSRKAYPMMNLSYFASQVLGQMKIDEKSAARGEVLNLDMTGYGPVLCDILNGDAELRFYVNINFDKAEPDVFIPVSSEEVQFLSKTLLAKYDWSGSKFDNLVAATTTAEYELNKLRPLNINRGSNDPLELNWTRMTLQKLVRGLVDPETAKPRFMSAEAANELVKTMTVERYGTVARQLSYTPQWEVGK